MPNLNLNLNNIQETLKAEAGPAVVELACRVAQARANSARPTDESLAAKSIRGAMQGSFQARIAKAMSEEERSVQQIATALAKSKGPALDGLGGAMSVPRDRQESDEDYRVRLEAANDLELKPLRTAIREAGETLMETLVNNPGPVLDLISETAAEMGAV